MSPSASADIRALNNLGQATGAWNPGSQSQKSAYRWTPGTGFTNITPLSAAMAWGNDINDAGAIAGVGTLDTVRGQRATLAVGSAMVNLGLLPGPQPFPSSEAVAINSAGEIVGSSSTSSATTHAVFWDAGHVIRDLGFLGTRDVHSWSFDINASGQVIGMSELDGKDQHPFMWTAAGGMVDLTPQLGPVNSVFAINDHGQIVGNYLASNRNVHAFLFTPGSAVRDLGTLGGPTSSVSGLNNLGQVVGTSMTASNTIHAFLWSPDEGMEDITELTGITRVRKLNDHLETITGDLYVGPARIVRLVVVPRASQSIVFTTPAPGRANIGESFVVAATSTSGLPVSFGSLAPSVCGVSGTTVRFLTIGECVVAADQGGSYHFRAAPRVTLRFLVTWPFDGFASPIDAPPAFNKLVAGHTSSLRFSLGGNRGMHVFSAGSPFSTEVSCTTGVTVGQPVVISANDLELRYLAGPDRYTLSWTTSSTWSGRCRELALRLADGSTHVALFAFR